MSSILEVNKESLEYAMDRLATYYMAHINDPRPDRVKSLNTYYESLGLSEEITAHIFSMFADAFGADDVPVAFIGMLVALAVAEYLREHQE